MRKRTAVGAGISLGTLAVVPAAAHAETFRVTNLQDGGSGSLRNAVAQANSDSDGDRVVFKSKLSGTIDLTTDAPILIYGGDLEIKGPGARRLAIDGGGHTRVVNLYAGVQAQPPIDVTISGLTLTGGNGSDLGFGGALVNYDEGNLTLRRVTISGNTSSGPGGGVHNLGTLTIDASTISGNVTEGDGSGFGGGGIHSGVSASLVVRNSTVSGNTSLQGTNGDAGDGGGIYVADDGEGEVRNSTVVGNSAEDSGGGTYFDGDVNILRGSVVASNEAANLGDDVYVGNEFEAAFNLVEDPETDGPAIPDSTNVLGVDPKLKPLKNNGGATDTHAFKKSPAKNKLPKGETPKSDQRGAKRKGKGDIGAYELVKCEGVIVNRVGTGKKDKLKGTNKKDGILGLGGNDKLVGKKGKDGLCGGKGKDKLKGGPGNDKLDGGPGKDKEIQ
jgi:RTX calcium-binding nonapeptide repeat (4 copies)